MRLRFGSELAMRSAAMVDGFTCYMNRAFRADQPAQMTSDTFTADKTRPAGFRIKLDGLMPAVHT